jgi:hypothetical protein
MALKQTIKAKDNFGIEVEIPNVYIKIETLDLNKISGKANLSYKNNSNLIKYNQIQFEYNINGENPIKQAYLHLKTLPEFADAVDC